MTWEKSLTFCISKGNVMTTHSKDCMCHLCLPGQEMNRKVLATYKPLKDKELKELIKKRGTPSYHKEHLKELELLEDGQIVFKCLDCDVSIFLGQLDGFD